MYYTSTEFKLKYINLIITTLKRGLYKDNGLYVSEDEIKIEIKQALNYLHFSIVWLYKEITFNALFYSNSNSWECTLYIKNSPLVRCTLNPLNLNVNEFLSGIPSETRPLISLFISDFKRIFDIEAEIKTIQEKFIGKYR